jgi:hypothetical protein
MSEVEQAQAGMSSEGDPPSLLDQPLIPPVSAFCRINFKLPHRRNVILRNQSASASKRLSVLTDNDFIPSGEPPHVVFGGDARDSTARCSITVLPVSSRMTFSRSVWHSAPVHRIVAGLPAGSGSSAMVSQLACWRRSAPRRSGRRTLDGDNAAILLSPKRFPVKAGP